MSCAPTRRKGAAVLAILHAVSDEHDPPLMRELYHLECEEIASFCQKATNLLEGARADALADLDFPMPITGACAPTTFRSVPTASSSAAAAWCRCSRPENCWCACLAPCSLRWARTRLPGGGPPRSRLRMLCLRRRLLPGLPMRERRPAMLGALPR